MDQVVIRRLAVLCVELSTAERWLAAELDTPTVPDLAGCACRALRKVDELPGLARRLVTPGGRVWVHVDAVVSVARQLALDLRRRGLAGDETRACVSLAVETLSLAVRLGLSVARRGETMRRTATILALLLGRAVVVGSLLLIHVVAPAVFLASL